MVKKIFGRTKKAITPLASWLGGIVLVLALIFGIAAGIGMDVWSWLISVFIIAGVVIGLVNITAKETPLAFFAIITLILVMGSLMTYVHLADNIPEILKQIVIYLSAVLIPAGGTVALTTLFTIGRKR